MTIEKNIKKLLDENILVCLIVHFYLVNVLKIQNLLNYLIGRLDG